MMSMGIDGHIEYLVLYTPRYQDGADGAVIQFHIYLDSAGLDVKSRTAWATFQASSPLTQLARSCCRGIDLMGGAASGYAGCEVPREIGQGYFYGMYYYESTWYREVFRVAWDLAGDARWNRVRSPEWAIYLGADLTRIADPERRLVQEYVGSDRGEPFASPFAEYLPRGGALFLASANPGEMAHYGLPCSFDMSGAVCNTVWLWDRFREKGLV